MLVLQNTEYLQSWLRPSAAPKRPHSVSSRKNWSFWGHQWKTISGISTIYGTWIMSSLLRPAFDLFLGAVTVPRSTGGWASCLVMWCIYSGRISDTVREHAWWELKQHSTIPKMFSSTLLDGFTVASRRTRLRDWRNKTLVAHPETWLAHRGFPPLLFSYSYFPFLVFTISQF